MNIVTLGLASRNEFSTRTFAVMNGEAQGAFLSFETLELLVQILTPMRWDIIKVMTGAGPLPVKELSHRLERDVKDVHADADGLFKAGVLNLNEDGSFEFPYDAVHVDFMLRAA